MRKTEAQRGLATCSKSHSLSVTELGSEPRPLGPRIWAFSPHFLLFFFFFLSLAGWEDCGRCLGGETPAWPDDVPLGMETALIRNPRPCCQALEGSRGGPRLLFRPWHHGGWMQPRESWSSSHLPESWGSQPAGLGEQVYVQGE